MDPDKIERHQAFFSRQPTDRPLIGSWLFGFFIHQQYPSVATAIDPGPIQPDDIPVDLFLKDVDALWEAYTELDDDYPFSMGAFYGVPWMEAIMGCSIHFSGTTMWADPCVRDWDTYDWKRPTLENNAWAQKLLEFLEALVKHSDGRFACGPTLMRGPVDMCAAMRGASNLGLDVYDCPENVRRLAKICADVWIEVGKAQLELVPESGNGYIVGCAGLRCWMPDKGIWLQDDAVSVLSPRLYEHIFLPQVQHIGEAFSMVAFHLHGNYLWPVDLLLTVNEIDVLELNYDVGVCELEKVTAAWKKIQEKKPLIAYADVTLEEFDRIMDELSPVGLSLQTLSPTMEAGAAKRDLVYSRASARSLMSIFEQISESVIAGDVDQTESTVKRALEVGHGPEEVLIHGLIRSMDEVGRRFENLECFVPEMLIAARAMKSGMAILRPLLKAADVEPVGRVVIGTVKGDLHDIGKNLVAVMLEGTGFEVIDLGVDVPEERFVEAVKEHKPDFVGFSVLLTTTMPGAETAIEALIRAGVRDDVKIMVGGAPVTEEWVERIGGDLYAPDAGTAARKAKAAMEG